jgi:hypothetical protein
VVYAKIFEGSWSIMSGKLLVGIVVGAMILGPYRITADQNKIEHPKVVKKTEMKPGLKKEVKPDRRFVPTSP